MVVADTSTSDTQAVAQIACRCAPTSKLAPRSPKEPPERPQACRGLLSSAHLDPTAASKASSAMNGVLPLLSAAASNADAVAGPTPLSTVSADRADCTAEGLGATSCCSCCCFKRIWKAFLEASTTSDSWTQHSKRHMVGDCH
jgi:hypothetical protein